MSDLNPVTLYFELLPTAIVLIVYLAFFSDRRNRFIEAFIALMFVKAVSFFIYSIGVAPPQTASYFNDFVETETLYWIFITNFVFHFAYALQEFLTWIMVSFVAVLFGQVVLILKLALQDPLKHRFANLINKVTGQTPISDGYLGLRDRMNHITFSDVETQPLNPEVVSKAWSESWKDYLMIGLVTIVLSIGVYQITGSQYTVGVYIFLTWIYRFGYPASNRIAKGLGIKLGDRDIGSEMMKGVLGWFFRLNLLLTLGIIGFQVLDNLQAGTLPELGESYVTGLVLATPPIFFALIMLPLTEGFSQVLYKKAFETIRSPRSKFSSVSVKGAALNLFSAIGTGTLAIAAFVGAVMGVTLNFAFNYMGTFFVYPDQVDEVVRGMEMNSLNNSGFIPPTIWTLLMLVIPLSVMLVVGVLGHYIRQRTKGGLEAFAFCAAVLVSVAIWFIMPGMDYAIGALPTPASFRGLLFYRLRPLIEIPMEPEYMLRLAYEFVVNVPIYISAALFVLYYFEFRQQWKKETAEVVGPILTVHARDVWDSVAMFTVGIAGSILGVLLLSYFIDIFNVRALIAFVIDEIGSPNGLEFVFAQIVSRFVLIAEHNMIRTLLMLVAAPVFWTLVFSLASSKKKESAGNLVSWASSLAMCMAAIAALVWTYLDAIAGKLNPTWPFVAELGLRGTIILGILFAGSFIVLLFNRIAHRESRGWWFPPLLMLLAIEYFVYDDQFTLIALVILPIIMTLFYKLAYHGTSKVANAGMLVIYIRMSLMALAVAEVLSTALWVAGLGTVDSLMGGSVVHFLAMTLPHGIVEIPAFLFAAAASLRIARDLAPTIASRDWESVRSKTWVLLKDMRLWRTYIMVLFFLLIGALIEGNITPIVAAMFGP